jgi:hypothetical protein
MAFVEPKSVDADRDFKCVECDSIAWVHIFWNTFGLKCEADFCREHSTRHWHDGVGSQFHQTAIFSPPNGICRSASDSEVAEFIYPGEPKR